MIKTELPPIGKINPAVFDGLIYPRLGAPSKDILDGPMHGVDCGVVRVAPGKVMAMTADPFFIVPDYGWERAAWFAFHILASDITTTGLKPSHLAVDLNLPLSIKREELETMWETVHRECLKYGVSVVTGHTAKYAGCDYPMVGGAFMTALGDEDKYVTTRMARPGDKIVVTKGAAIETCGLFAAACPGLIEEALGPELLKEADGFFEKMSTVEDALTAADGDARKAGITSMHDATECGIWGGLFEIARASGTGMRIEKESIILEKAPALICAHFGIDPYASISEGTLIITAREWAVPALLARLAAKGIKASVIGEVKEAKHGVKVVESGEERNLEHPVADPFWAAFAGAMELKAK
ncbi:MAG: AIR synthase family protein [Elusimicrobiales bacterium]|nr:AIR synthase family protein [Elusimicrobiales bacterium]